MPATTRFRQDFGFYFLGIIVPGVLNAAMIPIIKHLLGTEIFGDYSLKFNFLLLLLASLMSCICQGILRFRNEAANNLSAFYSQVFMLTKYLLLPVSIISFLVMHFYFHQTPSLSVIFILCVIMGSIQNILMSISQAGFESKFILLSEGARAFVFSGSAIIFLLLFKSHSQQLLFFSLLLSYLVSSILLIKRNKISMVEITGLQWSIKAFNTKSFLIYGYPLGLWFGGYYICTYLEKPFLAMDFGLTVQGNYQAMFDFIFKSITALMWPFATAILPILTKSLQEGKATEAFDLLRKLIWIQVAMLFIGVTFYWFFAFQILTTILAMPPSINYKTSGLLIAISCMVWQICFLNHKPYKLANRTDLLLKFMLVAVIVYIAVLIFIHAEKRFLFYAYALPFLVSGVCYNLLCYFFKGKVIAKLIIQ